MSGASVSGPDIIRDFRAQLLAFQKMAAAALSGRANELIRLREWLRYEQLPVWKKTLVKREELYQNAKRNYLNAEAEVTRAMNSRAPGKPSSIEERTEMNKTKRLKEEAEEKLATIQGWLLRIDREGEPLVAACKNHDLDLHERCEKASHQLEHLAERVQNYLDVTITASTPPPPAPGTH
jgi:hypothetical protein